MSTDKDPNSTAFHTGQECIIEGCKEPAGTAWGPHWCKVHNRERLDRITKEFAALVKGGTRAQA